MLVSTLAGGLPALLIAPRGEGGDDFFEAWVAAQRVPPGQQLQLAIAEFARWANGNGKLFTGQLFIANPRSDVSQRRDHPRAVD